MKSIIDCCHKFVLKKIAAVVSQAIFFPVLADETIDICRGQQLSLCVRHENQNKNIYERFLQFIPWSYVTVRGLALAISKQFSKTM